MIVQVDECKCPGRLDCTEMVPALVANHKKDHSCSTRGRTDPSGTGMQMSGKQVHQVCVFYRAILDRRKFQIDVSTCFDERRQISTSMRMCETAAIHDCSHRKVR